MLAVKQLLEQSPEIKSIYDKLQQLQQLSRYLNNFLPDYLAENCKVANLRDGVLVLVTNSPVWKNQLNLLRMDLLEKLRSSSTSWGGISSISVTIDYLTQGLHCYTAESSCETNLLDQCNQVGVSNNYSYNRSISKKTAKLVKNIVRQEITYSPLSEKLISLMNKISK